MKLADMQRDIKVIEKDIETKKNDIANSVKDIAQKEQDKTRICAENESLKQQIEDKIIRHAGEDIKAAECVKYECVYCMYRA